MDRVHERRQTAVQSSESEKKGDAQTLFTNRLGDAGKGIAVSPKVGKINLADGLRAVVDNQKTRGRKNIQQACNDESICTCCPTSGRIGGSPMISWDGTSDSIAHVRMNEEHATLATTKSGTRRGCGERIRLARKQGKPSLVIPEIETPTRDNARTGFLEPSAGRRDRRRTCPPSYRLPSGSPNITGWRFKSEVLPYDCGSCRSAGRGPCDSIPGETKNNRGRTFMLTTDLRRILTAQIASLAALKETRASSQGWIFHRADGTPIRRHAGRHGKRRVAAAGHPDALFHHFRRSTKSARIRTIRRPAQPRPWPWSAMKPNRSIAATPFRMK